MLKLDVNFFDWTILAIYFTLVVAIGVMARRAIATSEDFLLAGRSLPDDHAILSTPEVAALHTADRAMARLESTYS